jgi:CDP-2,3-bis-(O-geranylgeranyl)-sn-glycerol synthase
MTEQLFSSLIFFLPGAVSNVTPILINKVPFINGWNTPMDFGKSHRGVRILGDNKRWRGFFVGVMMGVITAQLLFIRFENILPYSSHEEALLAGFALSAGTLLGDALESFFKRQKGILSGQPWFPFDQLDYIVGGLIAVSFVRIPSFNTIVSVFILYFGIHLLSTLLGYKLGFKDSPI